MNKTEVFTRRSPENTTLWHKLFGSKKKEEAVTRIYKLLADNQILNVTYKQIYQIASRNNLKLQRDLKDELFNLYCEYLHYCLSDKFLSKKELEELHHLKKIMMLNDQMISKAHNEIAGRLYQMEVEKAVEDGRLEDDERDFLNKLQKDLKLDDALATKIYKNSAGQMVKAFMDEAMSDRRLTEDEEEELRKIKKSLSVEIHLDGYSRANFEKYKLFWQIENGDMPDFDIDEPMQVGEKCYFFTNAEWLNQKTLIKDAKAKKSQLEYKCSSGEYLQHEKEELKPVLEDIWATMDAGRIYLTNQRLILLGNERSLYLNLDEMVDCYTYKNGVQMFFQQRNLFLQFKDHIDIFSMLMAKALLNL